MKLIKRKAIWIVSAIAAIIIGILGIYIINERNRHEVCLYGVINANEEFNYMFYKYQDKKLEKYDIDELYRICEINKIDCPNLVEGDMINSIHDDN